MIAIFCQNNNKQKQTHTENRGKEQEEEEAVLHRYSRFKISLLPQKRKMPKKWQNTVAL